MHGKIECDQIRRAESRFIDALHRKIQCPHHHAESAKQGRRMRQAERLTSQFIGGYQQNVQWVLGCL
jgi:hypothetical protein